MAEPDLSLLGAEETYFFIFIRGLFRREFRVFVLHLLLLHLLRNVLLSLQSMLPESCLILIRDRVFGILDVLCWSDSQIMCFTHRRRRPGILVL
jgi:hypothetical protein